ncbi:murein biosynthesis integral membrane protein MurJ [Streptomyces catenulae]|uniref:Murein biosynthesis integral membrane protein MurJ n=1 Tax=Streptomyces catenulae TaxID=66875 RepID=A0ABV2Z548_9ACTN|nr:murein biosynthesis integral membrane protein MurJ [Streptomyces catenulae]
MNAPFDGDRGRGAEGDPAGPVPPAPQEPYGLNGRSPYAQDGPRYEAPQGHAPGYPGGAVQPPSGAPAEPFPPQPAAPYAPEQQGWGAPAPTGPAGPPAPAPYADAAETVQFPGVGDGFGQEAEQQPESDAFAHLFRDQQPYEPRRPVAAEPGPAALVPETAPAPEPPAPEPEPVAAAGKQPGGRASGLLKSSAVMAAGTMVSRLTGFVRSALIVAALGGAVLGDSWQVAYQLPTMIFILTIGGGLNSVFVPQLVRAMKEDDDGGEAYANRLLTLVIVILGALTVLAVVAAPLLVKLVSFDISRDPAANEVAVAFTRYCVPTIFFMGLHVVMGQILNARGRFGAMMWTPVLNNIVMIATFGLFIWVYGTAKTSGIGVTTIPDEGIRLLGIGTLLGLVVQALAMIPYLRDADFTFRLRFDWRGHGLGKAAKLAKWTVLFVLANQAGVLVVTQLSTWAGNTADGQGHPGTGFISYASAQLIWNMPQAIITVSVMAALLPRLARSAADGDTGAVRDDMSQGLRTSAVAIVPISFGFLALGVPLCTLVYGSSGAGVPMGYMLMAFGIGLIPFSVQYVILRAFYAYEDTRTPFYNTVIVAAVNAAASAACFLILPARWAVIGMAAAYGIAYMIGVVVAWRRLSRRMNGDLDSARIVRTYARLAGASIPATVIAGAAVYGIMQGLGSGFLGSLAALIVGAVALLGVFYVAARKMRIEEMTALVGMVRAKLGR